MDFAKLLVTLGLTATFLSLNEEWEVRARKRLMLAGFGAAAKRPYATVTSMSRSGVWITVCLPTGVLSLLDEFARSSGLGRTCALQTFLRLGLASYLRGKTTLHNALKTVAEQTNASTPE